MISKASYCDYKERHADLFSAPFLLPLGGITSAWVILAATTKAINGFKGTFLSRRIYFPQFWDIYFGFLNQPEVIILSLCFSTVVCQDRFAFVSQHVVGWTINLRFIVSSETKIAVESAHSLQIKQKSLKKYMQWIKSIRCDFYLGSFSSSCWERGIIMLYPLTLIFCCYSILPNYVFCSLCIFQ